MTTRLQTIDGTYNFRDLGGFAADGGVTRSGTLFRSDALHRLSDLGREQLTGLGVARVVDLRDAAESRLSPDLLPATAVLTPHPIFPDASLHIAARLDIFALTELIYLQHGDTLASAVALLAEESDSPRAGGSGEGKAAPGEAIEGEAFRRTATVFHCTAGKDRTGAVAALTLLALGVEREEVVTDYAESERHLAGAWMEGHLAVLKEHGFEVTPQVEGLVGSTPVSAINRALADIERQYGSVRDYLVAHGLPGATFERLHERFVERPASGS